MKNKIIVVLGPTASGKSDLAVYLAKYFNGEVISADSRQIYKGLNILSNKITKSEMGGIRHYMLDIVYPNQKYSLYNWQKDTFKTIEKILKKKKTPIIAGGTGLYICSILQNYDLHPKEPKLRDCPYDFVIFGINPSREKLYKKINQRVDRMLEDGSIEEVKKLYHHYKQGPATGGGRKYLSDPDPSALSSRPKGRSRRTNKKLASLSGIGYQQLIEYLDGNISLGEAIELIKRDTRHYAKRQMTWFRRMERQGLKIHWNKTKPQIKKITKKFLEE